MTAPLVKSTALAILEKALNSALQLDSGSLIRLGELEGNVFQVSCTRPSLSLLLIPHRAGIILQSPHAETEQPVDCHIIGNSTALLGLLVATNKSKALFSPNIALKGNTEIAQRLQKIMSELDIDWEEKASHWLGDIAAHQLGNQARSFLHWGRQTFTNLLMNTEEFIHEEARTMPPRIELECFYQDLEQLAVETDRIAARLQRLSNNMNP